MNEQDKNFKEWSLTIGAILLPWIPVVGLALYVKYAIVRWHGYFLLANLQGLQHPDQLPALSKLAMYGGDLLFGLGCIPLLLLAALPLLGRRGIVWCSAGLSLLFSLLLFIQLQCYYTLGRFLSLSFLKAAFSFSLVDSSVANHYISTSSILKLLIVIVLILIGLFSGLKLLKRPTGKFGTSRKVLAWTTLQVPLVVGLILLAGRQTPTPYHRAVLLSAVYDFIGAEQHSESRFAGSTDEQILAAYQELAEPPPSGEPATYFGQAAEYDLLLFVLETAPMRVFGEAGIRAFPAFNKLAEQGILANEHHTTYPISNRAIFSMLTSWYPSNTTTNFNHQYPNMRPPSAGRQLQSRGYATALFAPVPQKFENDDRMFEALGIDSIYFPKDLSLEAPIEGLPPHSGLEDNRKTFRLMQTTIAGYLANNQRYFAIITPTIGHAPWPDISPAKNVENWLERGRLILAEQDKWMAELLEQLRAAGRLDKTIIVLTSDHGLRTTREAPDLAAGTASTDSYHVPLLVYVPGVVPKTIEIPWVTSHIDIAPTLLDLFGVHRDRRYEQGSVLWNEGLKDRRTFFFGKYFLSADAVHEHGTYVMRSDVTGALYLSSTKMQFPDNTLLLPSEERYKHFNNLLSQFSSFQQIWVMRFNQINS